MLPQHHQLVSVLAGWTTLQRYVEKNGLEITGEQRVDIAHTLASMAAELHSFSVAHRDIARFANTLENIVLPRRLVASM